MAEPESNAEKPHANIIFILSLVLLLTGVVIGVFHRYIDTEMAIVMLLVFFTLSLSSALMLFYFLTSTAHIEKGVYSVGGAAAGFIVVFTMLFYWFKDPAMYENKFYALANSEIVKELYEVAQSYNNIVIGNNKAIKHIANTSIAKTRSIFNDLGNGEYLISSYDLPIYLMPMVDNAKHSYLATQYVLPDKFWEQLWAEQYFQKNVAAVKNRGIDLRRIFILDSSEARKQKDILEELMRKHVNSNLDIRIIFKDALPGSADGLNLKDFVIADKDITGTLILNRDGGFSEVEFSTDQVLINKRIRQFESLWALSMSYNNWLDKYYNVWKNG